MGLYKIVNILLIAGVLQAFVFNLVTLFFRKRFSIVVLYLNLTVLFISLNNLQAWLIDSGYISNWFIIRQMLVPWYLMIFPMFYAFAIHFLNVDDRITGFVKISIVVFVVEIFLRFSLAIYVYYTIPDRDTGLVQTYTTVEDIFNLLFGLLIFYRAWQLVFKREEAYRQMLSYDDLKWLRLFMKLGLAILIFWIFALVLEISTGLEWGYLVLRLGTSILLYWIGYQGLYRYNLVQDRIHLRRTLASNQKYIGLAESSKPYEPERYREDFKGVHAYVVGNQKFMDSELSMGSLAAELEISSSHLSKVINNCSGYNFPDYINSLRVEQAKKLLADPEFKDYTIVAIGLECGFNSRSTFYTAFKKFTNITPSEFIKKLP